MLPVHNIAYVGILGNVARREDALKGELDLSVWYVLVVLATVGFGVVTWFRRDVLMFVMCAFSLSFVWIIGTEIHYCLFKLYSKHPVLVSFVWFFPGVVLWQALVAEKRLEESLYE